MDFALQWLAEASRALDTLETDWDNVTKLPQWKDLVRRVNHKPPSPRKNPDLLRHQKRIVEEVISSEKTYVASLETLVQYSHELEDAARGGCLPLEKVVRIFSNVEDLLLVNRELLGQLEARFEDSCRIGDIFQNMSFALRLYSRYITDYEAARSTLADCEACEKSGLESLMIMPVQRIPRYELLLRELVKVNRKLDDEHLEELEQSLEAVKDVAEANNEKIRENESKALLYDVQRRFWPPLQLVVTNRHFVKEGALRKVNGRGGAQVECRLILLSDVLLYAQPGPTALHLHRKIDVADSATEFKDHAPCQIAVLNAEKSMVFLCKDATEKDEWLSALRKARLKAGTVDKDKIAMSLWERDTPSCQVTRVKFTTLIRRHHCRVNGECVSADASKARFILSELGDRFTTEERVCDWCCRDYTLAGGSWAQVVKGRDDLRSRIQDVDSVDKALSILRPRLHKPVVMGSWIWKESGRTWLRNWKKRWLELRGNELFYFDEPGDDDPKGRFTVEKLRPFGASLSFVVGDNTRDYPMRIIALDQEEGPMDRGQYYLWIAAIQHVLE